MTSCRYGHSDGAYVLGALSPPERAEYESHLETCPACTAAVAGLAPVPGLLSRADPAALEPVSADPQPARVARAARLPELLRSATAQRRRQAWRHRWRLAGAMVGSAALAVAGSAVWLGGPADAPPAAQPSGADPSPVSALAAQARDMQPVAGPVPVLAQVATGQAAAGTEVWMWCAYPEADYDETHTFRLVAVGADGTREQVGSWLAGPGDEVTLTGVTRFTDDLARLELHADDGTRLLTHEVG